MIRALFLLAIALPTAAFAGPVKLAETDLTDAKDWDVVNLPPCAGSDNVVVTKVGIAVTKYPAQIDRLALTFQDGTTQELQVRHRFDPGAESRWIDVDGPARCIAQIRIIGDADTLGWRPRRQAHVVIGGMHPDIDVSRPEGARLGAVRLTDAKDWDLVTLPPCAGTANMPISALRLKVNDHPASIDRLVVTYQNGDNQDLALRERFAPGSTSRWIDLAGPARCIQTIRVVGDTTSIGWQPEKQAEVVFQGKTLH